MFIALIQNKQNKRVFNEIKILLMFLKCTSLSPEEFAIDDSRAPLRVREVCDEQPHREKRSPLFFGHGKYGNFHSHQCGFLSWIMYQRPVFP